MRHLLRQRPLTTRFHIDAILVCAWNLPIVATNVDGYRAFHTEVSEATVSQLFSQCLRFHHLDPEQNFV